MFPNVKPAYLEFLAKQAPEILVQKLCEPCLIDWNLVSADDAGTMLETIRYQVHPEIFDRFLLCCTLLGSQAVPAWFTDLVAGRVDMDRYLPGWSFSRSKDTRWAVASFPAAMGHAAQICHMLIGVCPGASGDMRFPFNMDQLMEKESVQQILTAVSAVMKKDNFSCCDIFVLPLFSHSQGPKISGKSHGLALALALKSLMREKAIPENLIATGRVDENGCVMPVGALDQKIKVAVLKGFALFLFPRQSAEKFSGRAFPVDSIDDAWLIARLFSPEYIHQLLFLDQITRSPETFIDKLDQIPAVWFKNMEFQDRINPVMNQILNSSALMSKLVGICCKKFETLDPDSRKVRGRLLSEKMIDDLLSDNPEMALAACTFQIHLCNRIGDTVNTQKWIQKGDRIENRVRNINLNSVVRYWNHRLVARHNQYRFDPEIETKLAEIIRIYSDQHQTGCRMGYSRRPNFGELCGTIAQNFGFCGPDFLDQVRYYTSMAQEAFGMNHCPEVHEQEWYRQLNYLTYALLDAGKYLEARETLRRYLKLNLLENLSEMPPDRFSSWEHALICRYFSETTDPALTAKMTDWLINASSLVPNTHPGQLWAFNLGKIMTRMNLMKQAEKWFFKSLHLCLSDNAGVAIRVMALLPLSNLFKWNLMTDQKISGFEKMILKAVNVLNERHFEIIKQLNFTDALEKLYDFPEILFPFSYR